MTARPTKLALEDDTFPTGRAFGEVVFNNIIGFQEVLTNPTDTGQTVCITYTS